MSILHRLDKATSGVLVFGKTDGANRIVGQQFERREVEKRYELIVRRSQGDPNRRCEVPIGGKPAATAFARDGDAGSFERWMARPTTGRTHQVRIHADALGMPVVGDDEHGGPEAARLFLHAAGLGARHPDGSPRSWTAPRPASFDALVADGDRYSATARARVALESRDGLFDARDTDAYLWIDRDHDGFPAVRVERLGDVALVIDQREDGDVELPVPWMDALESVAPLKAIFHVRRVRGGGGDVARCVRGAADPRFHVTEHGLRYLIDLSASSTSTGLFLDQRETRRDLLAGDLSERSVVNVFAHTGSLSVAAASAGAETLTLDLSKRYLDWARDNFRANGLDPDEHDFIYGDALDWMGRLARKGRRFDVVLVDPPSASTTRKGSKRWRVDRDLGELVTRAVELCSEGGRVVCVDEPPQDDLDTVPGPPPNRSRGCRA